MLALVADGLYIGDTESSNPQTLSNNNITTIINLADDTIRSIEDTEIINYILPDQELMDTEIPKMCSKLDTIMNHIISSKKPSKNVLIRCNDGKNKSALAAGYYLISSGEHYDAVINKLETLYFNQQQKIEEAMDKEFNSLDPEIKQNILNNATPEMRLTVDTGRSERRALKCLTMITYQKLLRKKGGAKNKSISYQN